MKKQHFLPAAVIPALLFITTAAVLISCEPENMETNVEEVNLENSLMTSASNRDLPLKELAELRATVAPWHNFDAAYEAGYQLEVTGYRSMMGYHYLNVSLLDDTFELTKPELLLFVPGPNGKLRFVGVEYAVPITDMDNPPPAPEGFEGDADIWSINTEFNLWTLHAWVGLNNPNGIFASRNPRLP